MASIAESQKLTLDLTSLAMVASPCLGNIRYNSPIKRGEHREQSVCTECPVITILVHPPVAAVRNTPPHPATSTSSTNAAAFVFLSATTRARIIPTDVDPLRHLNHLSVRYPSYFLTTPLTACLGQEAADRSCQACVLIGDHELDTAEAAVLELLEELRPALLNLLSSTRTARSAARLAVIHAICTVPRRPIGARTCSSGGVS